MNEPKKENITLFDMEEIAQMTTNPKKFDVWGYSREGRLKKLDHFFLKNNSFGRVYEVSIENDGSLVLKSAFK